MNTENPFEYYPKPEQVAKWLTSIYELGQKGAAGAEVLNSNGFQPSFRLSTFDWFRHVRFQCNYSDDFYAYWQPAFSAPAPLVIHVPGYGSEMSTHPTLVEHGYNVLHISPMGYMTPDGPQEHKKQNGDWPVLPDTISSYAEAGYKIWLANCVQAITWACGQPQVLPNRISFMGTSQGGGTALILASMYQGKGVRCVGADMPYLTNHPMSVAHHAYPKTEQGIEAAEDIQKAWFGIGLIDTISHAHRLDLPVLLVAGKSDDVCLPETILDFDKRLPGTHALMQIQNAKHHYSHEFLKLFEAWLSLYA